jgi:hypothetical protein
MTVILETQEAEMRWFIFGDQSRYNVYTTISWQFTTQTRTGRVAEVVECLPRKGEALNSHPCTPNEKEINKKSASHSRVQPHCRSNIFHITNRIKHPLSFT